jgi:uncharacterized RDD family membrane protein YckC
MEDKLTLETPEQLELNYNLARLGSRFIAAAWDSLFIVLLEILLIFAVAFLVYNIGVDNSLNNWVVGIAIFLAFLIFWSYYVIFEILWNGQSPGKRLAGIRTVRSNGAPITLSESAIRNLVRLVDFFPGLYSMGVIVMFIDLKSRRLGDFAAGTVVVHERTPVSLDVLGKQVTTDSRLLEPTIANLSTLDEGEVEAVRRFLQRRDTLHNSQHLGAMLARRIREHLGMEVPVLTVGDEREDVLLLQRVVAQWD